MADHGKELTEQQLFWTTLFQGKKLAPQLASLATDHVDGITYIDMPRYGQVHFLVQAASSLGDNFMSDTFTVVAHLKQRDTTKTFRAFAKVKAKRLH